MRGVKSGQQFLVIASALGCLAWTDIPRDRVVAGNRAFHAGEFADAIEAYGQGLVDHPDSPVLNFNMGTANYKAGKYTEAISSFSRVQTQAADPKRTAKTAYNAGNAQYKLGAHAEEQNPQAALTAYTNALASYRRALGADPTDQDTKFNYEFVTKKLEELQEKLQNQQQQQQPNQQPNQQDQQQQQEQSQQSQGQQQEQQQQDEQDEQDGGQDESAQQQDEQQAKGQEEESAESSQPDQSEQAGQTPQNKDQQNDMSSDEARSVIDTARNEELSPEEFARQAQRGTVAEPVQDW